MADDRRTTGMYVEDENIEWKALGQLAEKFPGAHVNSTSYNRRVLLTGEAPTEDVKKKIGDEVRAIASVRRRRQRGAGGAAPRRSPRAATTRSSPPT